MKWKWLIPILGICILSGFQPAFCEEPVQKPETASVNASSSLEEIITGIENRYSGDGFTARFTQQSTIKAMDITDTAEGKLFVKRPGMMRWEYETPEEQVIITDGELLWIYRPVDNQVMIGEAPNYFGEGKGASFLSDIRKIRDNFDISIDQEKKPEKNQDKEDYKYVILKLIPHEKKLDLASIYLAVSKDDYQVDQVTTYNAYEDETVIRMFDYQFDQNIDDSVFTFEAPEGADVIQIEE